MKRENQHEVSHFMQYEHEMIRIQFHSEPNFTSVMTMEDAVELCRDIYRFCSAEQLLAVRAEIGKLLQTRGF